MELKIINPLEIENWDSLALSTENGSIFHSAAWARVLHDSYNYRPLYFAHINQNKFKTLIPLMEVNSFITGRRGVSLPFSDICEPITSKTIDETAIFESIKDFGREAKWKYLELRPGKIFLNSENVSEKYFAHILDLHKDEQITFAKFRNSTRRNIKKAKKEKVEVEISDSADALKTFYQLNCLTRKRHGLPPQPYYFFEFIYKHIISKNMGIIVLSLYKSNPIAGSVFIHFGKNAFYKYGASDLNFQHLRANNLVMWNAIKWYCQNGYQTLHMGRTEPENAGLKQFKNGWGTNEEPIYYYRYDLKKNEFIKNNNRAMSWHNKIFNRMPDSLLRLVGTALYKHVG